MHVEDKETKKGHTTTLAQHRLVASLVFFSDSCEIFLFFPGLKVRAFLRDPNKLPANLRGKVEIMIGDVLEPDSVQRAVEGMDGVVICLGTGDSLAPTSDMSEGTKNIIDAMRQKNVNVVSACLSAFLIYEPSKVPEKFVPLNEDHKRMHNALKDSSLNYIVVFPPHIAGKY